MKAMILAAGFGTRLRPLTDNKPKALVEINGTPMLEIVIRKFIKSGIRDIIINTHTAPGDVAEGFGPRQRLRALTPYGPPRAFAAACPQ